MKLNMPQTWMVSLIFKLVESVSLTKPTLSISLCSGITMNGLQLPGSIAGSYRDGYATNVCCAYTTPGETSAGTCTLLQKGTGEAIVGALAGGVGLPGYGKGETPSATTRRCSSSGFKPYCKN